MPELPEVETVVNELKNHLINQKVVNFKLLITKLLKNATEKQVKTALVNKNLLDITRKGKYIIFSFEKAVKLVVHLRMEGKFFILKANTNPHIHTMAILVFENQELHYNDTRKFGTFQLYLNQKTFADAKDLNKLGLDPLEENFSWQYLKKQIANSSRAIKTVLLDQTNISGIGNIYADEILFASKINPLRKPSELTDSQFKAIAKNATKILAKAVALKGTTIATYTYKQGHAGEFQKFLQVHLRKNQPCFVCKNLIKKITVNGRGTYFCEYCQK